MSLNSTHLVVAVNLDKTGYTVSTVSDKIGYTITAGTYSGVRSVQQGVTFIDDNAGTTGTTTVASVATTKAILNGGASNSTGAGDSDGRWAMYVQLTSNVLVTGTRGANQGSSESRHGWGLSEPF